MKPNYYTPTSGKLHPLVKEFALVLTVVLVLLRPGFQGALQIYVIWLATLWLLWTLAGLNIKRAYAAILIAALLSSILIASQGFLYRSSETFTPLFRLFDLEISGRSLGTFTVEGLIAGLGGSLKIFCVLVSAQLFITTTSIDDFAYTLMKLRIPRNFAFVIVTGMRFVPLVEQTWRDILDAKQLRGLDIKKLAIMRKVSSLYPQALVSLVLSLFKAGLHLHIAIVTRGFHTKGRKTLYYTMNMHRVDYVILAGLALLFSLEVVLLFRGL